MEGVLFSIPTEVPTFLGRHLSLKPRWYFLFLYQIWYIYIQSKDKGYVLFDCSQILVFWPLIGKPAEAAKATPTHAPGLFSVATELWRKVVAVLCPNMKSGETCLIQKFKKNTLPSGNTYVVLNWYVSMPNSTCKFSSLSWHLQSFST